ncbi:NAD(P)-dependent alcohol dehydrogenase [Lentilactobacillus hilgardii]|uniref:NAD(P)-dependent alcohol dehydrogenase n=1 Tax=Lentilactobacillus hilgardii TaxID=1588 RepID=UPI0039EC0BF0
MRMKAYVATSKGASLQEQTLMLDEPKHNEVLVKIKATGICHTDAVARDLGLQPFPAVLGHEGAGIVEEVGSGITNIKQGDHVVLSCSYCGHCKNCLAGHPAACLHFAELNNSGINYDGSHRIHDLNNNNISTFFGQSSFAEYAVVDEHNITKVDKDIDLSLVAPIGCGIQTGAGTVLNRLKPEPNQSLAVFGTGAVGLAAVMAAKLCGVGTIIAIDANDARLALARKIGATHTINGRVEDTAKTVKAITKDGADYTIDTAGVSSVTKEAISTLSTFGTAALLGATADVTLNVMGDLIPLSKKVEGIVEGDVIPQLFIPMIIDEYKKGNFPLDQLVKRYKFSDINTAFRASAKGEAIKPVLVW